jgi:hypothetical protein
MIEKLTICPFKNSFSLCSTECLSLFNSLALPPYLRAEPFVWNGSAGYLRMEIVLTHMEEEAHIRLVSPG